MSIRLRDIWAFVGLAGLTLVHTWPLSLSPARASFVYNHDGQLHLWIVGWVARQLGGAPGTLHDANIYHPLENSLTTVDSMLFPSALAAPALWLTGDLNFSHNLSWILGFVLTAACTYLLCLHVTDDRWASVLGACAFAFNAHVASRYPHLMAIHMEWIPLGFLALDRLLRRPSLRWSVLLGLVVAGASLTSAYTGMLLVIGLVSFFLARIPSVGRESPLRLTGLLAISMGVFALVSLPLLRPWLTAGLDRTGAGWTAGWVNYLATSSNVHLGWSRQFWEMGRGTGFFPGVVVLALAGFATTRLRDRIGRYELLPYVVVGVVGVVLSFGPATPVYRLIAFLVSPLDGMRAVIRFGLLFVLGVSVLAAFGLAQLRERFSRTWFASGLGLLAVLVMNVESYAPPHVVDYEPVPSVYDRLADAPADTVLVELPFYSGKARHLNARYVLNSTAHWRSLVNGYGSFAPEHYDDVARRLERLPSQRALEALRGLETTHVMIHVHEIPRRQARRTIRYLRRRNFRVLARQEGHVLLELRPRRSRD